MKSVIKVMLNRNIKHVRNNVRQVVSLETNTVFKTQKVCCWATDHKTNICIRYTTDISVELAIMLC